ncbi:MAG: hypothetical protein HQM08_28355 [Candidatus Riflebacteria bacterium]|nr:hypothetical protein [Candidatus Riflebacteria bacterium]
MNLRRLVFFLVVCFFNICSFSDKPVFCQEIPTKTPLSSFPPGYVLVDAICLGTLSGWLAMDMGYGTTVLRSEVVSPFDGSTAIKQERVSYGPMDGGWSGFSRNYQLGYNCPQGTKIALFTVLHAPPAGGNAAALVSISFRKSDTQVGFIKGGVGLWGPLIPLDFQVANDFSGILEIEANNLTEPFDNFTITFENQASIGDSSTIFDEIRILPFNAPGQTLQFSESPTFILIGKDDQRYGSSREDIRPRNCDF